MFKIIIKGNTQTTTNHIAENKDIYILWALNQILTLLSMFYNVFCHKTL